MQGHRDVNGEQPAPQTGQTHPRMGGVGGKIGVSGDESGVRMVETGMIVTSGRIGQFIAWLPAVSSEHEQCWSIGMNPVSILLTFGKAVATYGHKPFSCRYLA